MQKQKVTLASKEAEVKINDEIINEYFEAMQAEINPSINYRDINRNTLNKLSRFHKNKPFEVSSCRLDGNSDGILQKFDSAKYQACRLLVDGQKAYSDGFIIGCTQVGNTLLICQALVDSSKLNVNIPTTQTPTQAATEPIQGIQPSAVNE